jgi:hypothetical protein
VYYRLLACLSHYVHVVRAKRAEEAGRGYSGSAYVRVSHHVFVKGTLVNKSHAPSIHIIRGPRVSRLEASATHVRTGRMRPRR